MAILPDGDPKDWSFDQFADLVKNIINFALTIGAGIAIIYIIWGAYLYFTAFGNEEKATQGKNTATWALVGVAVILASKVVIITLWSFLTGKPPDFGRIIF